MEITLEKLLESRDARCAMQQDLMLAHPASTLICLTVVMPGSVKRNKQSLVIANAAVKALREEFSGNIKHLIERDLETGYETFILVDLPALEAKRRLCIIEESHPLGRLFDMDVITKDGIPLSREAVGRKPRLCMLCGNEARWCMRNHTHSQEELHNHINSLVDSYVRGI